MFQKYRLWIFFSVFLLYRSDCYKEKILSSNWFTLVNFDLVVSKGTFVCEGAQCTAHLDSYLAVWSWSSSMTSVTSQVIFFNSKRRMFNFTVIEITWENIFKISKVIPVLHLTLMLRWKKYFSHFWCSLSHWSLIWICITEEWDAQRNACNHRNYIWSLDLWFS